MVNPYQALYGYTVPLGAYQVMYGATNSHHQKYKRLLHMMSKVIRLRKKAARTGNSKKRAKLIGEVKKLRHQIKALRAQLQQSGVDTSNAESEATTQEAMTADDGSGDGSDGGNDNVVSSSMHKARHHIRRLGSQKRHHIHRMGSSRKSTMHAKRQHYRKTKMPYRHKKVKGRMGIRTSAVRMHKYVLARQHAAQLHQLNPRKHRARLPGQRAFDGRRRQGPISAQEVAQQDISPDSDMDMDAMTMPMPTDLTPTDIPDIDFDMNDAPESMIDSASMAAEAALSGVMDFAGGLWSNKFVKYGAIGLGLWFVFGKKLR